MPSHDTYRYLEEQFGSYYDSIDFSTPPDADAREWGYIPWPTSGNSNPSMVRHRSLVQMGDPSEYFGVTKPRHVYCTAARWETPAAGSMTEKNWQNADLVFDIDADHLEGVDDDTTLDDLLSYAKTELQKLLHILEHDFGFDDLTVVFSGGRGYHVHVRDDHVRSLEKDERGRIVEYVIGQSIEYDALVSRDGSGIDHLRLDNGWGRRIHRRLLEFQADLKEMAEDEAIEYLQSFDGIGDDRASGLYNVLTADRSGSSIPGLRDGNVGLHPAFGQVARPLSEEVLSEQAPDVDVPVTTDVNRLMRVPGSLHGGTALQVMEVPRDEIESFRPTVDAIPEPFTDETVRISVSEETTVTVAEYGSLSAGTHEVPKPVGIHLMAQDDAEIAPSEG